MCDIIFGESFDENDKKLKWKKLLKFEYVQPKTSYEMKDISCE
jgi:hypothetical protein